MANRSLSSPPGGGVHDLWIDGIYTIELIEIKNFELNILLSTFHNSTFFQF